jgi:hypothetical protein
MTGVTWLLLATSVLLQSPVKSQDPHPHSICIPSPKINILRSSCHLLKQPSYQYCITYVDIDSGCAVVFLVLACTTMKVCSVSNTAWRRGETAERPTVSSEASQQSICVQTRRLQCYQRLRYPTIKALSGPSKDGFTVIPLKVFTMHLSEASAWWSKKSCQPFFLPPIIQQL